MLPEGIQKPAASMPAPAMYGKMRRTDFLPVGEEQANEILERGCDSQSSGDGCDRGYEHAAAWSFDPDELQGMGTGDTVPSLDFGPDFVAPVPAGYARPPEAAAESSMGTIVPDGVNREPFRRIFFWIL